MRGKHHIVTATDTFFAHPVFHRLANQTALRMPEDQPRTGDLLNGKQVELLAKNAVIASLNLFQPLEVRIQILRVEERRPVNTLQLLVLLVAQPVSSGDRGHLERLDPPRRRHMRAAAEVYKPSVAIQRNLLT